MAAQIHDYAIIGDCRSAALISRGGSLDWLCWPRFDSPSIFAAILDEDKGGRFLIAPQGPFRSERSYQGFVRE
jgi:GH15 family glucan-1,4-alpha-glucosidase